MNYQELFYDDYVNGTGLRTSLFVSGCGKVPKCKGCYNQDAWCFDYGKPYTKEVEEKILKSLSLDRTAGLSLLGGDPMSNVMRSDDLLNLVKRVKELYPTKTIFCWTGFLFENLIKEPKCLEFFKYIDMLRDGEYIEELRDVTQYLEGSKNQRSIDVQQSLRNNTIVEYKFD